MRLNGEEAAHVLPSGSEQQIRDWLASLNAADLSAVYQAALLVTMRSHEPIPSDPAPS